jgi:glycosyltransferase involved in cell wall biosynthesis
MKLIVLISIESSWSREIVHFFLDKGIKVYALDISSRNGYQFKNSDSSNDIEIEKFKNRLSYYKHIRSNNQFSKIFKLAFEIRKINSKYQTNKIFSCYAGLFAAGAYLSFIRPYYLYIVGSDVIYLNWFKKSIYKYAFSNAKIIFSNGAHLISHSKNFFPDANYIINYIGINNNNIDRLKTSKKHSEKLIFICTRGFDSVYNNLFILKSFSLLPKHLLNNIKLIFTSNGVLFDEALQFADKKFEGDIRKNIIFLGGVSYGEIINNLCQSDVYLSCSLSDGVSLSLLEAMNIGLYPILSDIDGNREVVKDGLFISPYDIDAFVFKLQNLISGNSEYGSYNPIFNREIVNTKFDFNTNMENLLNEVIK